VEWIHLAQDSARGGDCEYGNENSGSPKWKGWGYLTWLTTCWLRKINSAPWKLLLPFGLVTPL